jgi:hypothetical protein
MNRFYALPQASTPGTSLAVLATRENCSVISKAKLMPTMQRKRNMTKKKCCSGECNSGSKLCGTRSISCSLMSPPQVRPISLRVIAVSHFFIVDDDETDMEDDNDGKLVLSEEAKAAYELELALKREQSRLERIRRRYSQFHLSS